MNAFQKLAVIMTLLGLAYVGSVLIGKFWGWAMDKLLGPVDYNKDQQ